MQRRYERLQATAAVENCAYTQLSAMSHATGAFFSYFVLFATAAAGAYLVIEGSLSQGALAACSLLAGRATQPFLRSMAFWSEFQSVQVAERNLAKVLAIEPEAVGAATPEGDVRGRIEVEGLSMAYGDRTVFDNVNLVIEPGETVLIEGGIGAGKSTLLRLIGGVSQSTGGSIRLDGLDLKDFDPATLRREVAYMRENAVLFRGTILDNLTLFEPERHLDRAMELASALNLDHAIAKLPDGFETEVGDDLADLLPLGVRQQIAIVRALARRPRVILFDQPNGGLDPRVRPAADEPHRRHQGRGDHSHGDLARLLPKARGSLDRRRQGCRAAATGCRRPPALASSRRRPESRSRPKRSSCRRAMGKAARRRRRRERPRNDGPPRRRRAGAEQSASDERAHRAGRERRAGRLRRLHHSVPFGGRLARRRPPGRRSPAARGDRDRFRRFPQHAFGTGPPAAHDAHASRRCVWPLRAVRLQAGPCRAPGGHGRAGRPCLGVRQRDRRLPRLRAGRRRSASARRRGLYAEAGGGNRADPVRRSGSLAAGVGAPVSTPWDSGVRADLRYDAAQPRRAAWDHVPLCRGVAVRRRQDDSLHRRRRPGLPRLGDGAPLAARPHPGAYRRTGRLSRIDGDVRACFAHAGVHDDDGDGRRSGGALAVVPVDPRHRREPDGRRRARTGHSYRSMS